MKTKKPSFLATAAAAVLLLLLALSRATATAQDDLATPPPPGSFRLLNGVDMPLVGFGTAGLGGRSEAAPLYALLLGFRHLDTAQAKEWYSEEDISLSIEGSSLPREDIFLATKIHPRNFGFEQTLLSFEDPDSAGTSLGALRTNYVDLLLLHTSDCSDWSGLCAPDPERGTFFDAWRALEKLYELGKVRAIGVSNFNVRQLEALSATSKVPVQVVQNYMDPFRQDREVRAWCEARGVLYTSYSTLGSQWQHRSEGGRRGENPVLSHPVVQKLAKRHNISEVLLVLTWALQEGVAVIPRSSQVEHIEELARLLPRKEGREGGLGVVLSEREMEEMRGLDGEEPWKAQRKEL